MAENSKSVVAILSLVAVACVGGSAVLWASFSKSTAALEEELRQSEMQATDLTTRLERAKKAIADSVKPSPQPESVVSEGEMRALNEKLRVANEELQQTKEQSDRYKNALEKTQVGMRAAAELQKNLHADLTKEKNKVRQLEVTLKALRAEKEKIEEALSKLKALKNDAKNIKVPDSLPSPLKKDGAENSFNKVPRHRARLVSLRRMPQDEDADSLKAWVAAILKAGPQKTAGLVALAGDDARIGKAVASILNDPALTLAALSYVKQSSWWTYDRVVARARQGFPGSAPVIEELGHIVHAKAKSENKDIAHDAFSDGILGAAHVRYLASRPVHEVSLDSFLSLMDAPDAKVKEVAQSALVDPRRRHEWISAVLEKRAGGEAFPENLEACVFENLENSAASSVMLARNDAGLAEKLRLRIPAWANDQPDETVRRVAMETLPLCAGKTASDSGAWKAMWAEVWPDYKNSGTDLVSWLGKTHQDRRVMREVLASPSFGCANIDNALIAPRARLASLVRQLKSVQFRDPALGPLWQEIIKQDHPLIVPLMADGLGSVPQSIAMELATELLKVGHPSGEAWFRASLANDFDRRMATVERLFEIATPKAHEIAQSCIVGNGDPRTTFRVVELGWEEDVGMSRERVSQVLRSPFLDPVRLDVFMAYFEKWHGEELPGMVAEALLDPSAERPETLLDYLSYCPDQNLLPLISRYLEAERSHVREAALRAMVPLKLTSVATDLMKLIADPEPMVRIQLARCLGSLGGDSVARGGLLVLCKDASAFVREAAFDAMASHVPDKLLPALRLGIGDEVRDVAVAAAKTMITTGNHDDAAYDLLFKTVEDYWLGPPTRAFLAARLGQDLKTRDEWRAWWATNGNK